MPVNLLSVAMWNSMVLSLHPMGLKWSDVFDRQCKFNEGGCLWLKLVRIRISMRF
jgi:hypothetical protein